MPDQSECSMVLLIVGTHNYYRSIFLDIPSNGTAHMFQSDKERRCGLPVVPNAALQTHYLAQWEADATLSNDPFTDNKHHFQYKPVRPTYSR